MISSFSHKFFIKFIQEFLLRFFLRLSLGSLPWFIQCFISRISAVFFTEVTTGVGPGSHPTSFYPILTEDPLGIPSEITSMVSPGVPLGIPLEFTYGNIFRESSRNSSRISFCDLLGNLFVPQSWILHGIRTGFLPEVPPWSPYYVPTGIPCVIWSLITNLLVYFYCQTFWA